MHRIMDRWLALALCVATMLASASEATEIRLSYHLRIDADGRLTGIDAEGQPHPALDATLRSAVAAWRFAPGEVDGVPQPTESWLHLRLAATQAEGGQVVLHVLSADLGPSIERNPPPRYPRKALERGIEGEVRLQVTTDADGRVVDVQPAQAHPDMSGLLVDASIKAVRQWRYRPERVAGRGVATTLDVPVCFTLMLGQAPRRSRGCSARADDPPRALRTAARLDDNVEGTRLTIAD